MHSIRHSVLAVATFLPMLAGCRAGDSGSAGDAVAAGTVAPAEVVIRARDNVFHEAPDTMVAGVTNIRLINEGPSFHHVWLVRLEEGRTMDELLEHMAQGGPMPTWAVDVGGPNTPGAPGGETSALVDLEPGSYVLLCVVDLPGGVPHVMKGMVRPMTVVPNDGPSAEMPPADIVMRLDDYTFETDIAITPGRRTIRIENAAAQPHEVLIVRLDEGRTVQEFMEFLETGEGTPPGTAMGGVTGIAQGGVNQITLDFEMGDYGLICFVPDASDGRPHFLHGMVQQIHVM